MVDHLLLLSQAEIDAIGSMGDFHAPSGPEWGCPFTEEALQSLRDKIEPLRSQGEAPRGTQTGG